MQQQIKNKDRVWGIVSVDKELSKEDLVYAIDYFTNTAKNEIESFSNPAHPVLDAAMTTGTGKVHFSRRFASEKVAPDNPVDDQ